MVLPEGLGLCQSPSCCPLCSSLGPKTLQCLLLLPTAPPRSQLCHNTASQWCFTCPCPNLSRQRKEEQGKADSQRSRAGCQGWLGFLREIRRRTAWSCACRGVGSAAAGSPGGSWPGLRSWATFAECHPWVEGPARGGAAPCSPPSFNMDGAWLRMWRS